MADTAEVDIPKIPGFWEWLFLKDEDGYRGISNLSSRWTLGAILVAVAFAVCGHASASELAKNVAIPASGGLIGLSFAWAGRSSSLLQDKEFSSFLIEHGPPAAGYVYSFQLAILTVVTFMATCGALIMGGTGFSTGSVLYDDAVNRFALGATGLIALRECWGVIYFANKLSIQFYMIKKAALP